MWREGPDPEHSARSPSGPPSIRGSLMPVFEMPLAELHTYTGRNPKPRDFDEFWLRALAELESTDHQAELKPAAFKSPIAECFDLYFSGVGGARIHAMYLRPKATDRVPAILRFHGYRSNSGDW